jgi:hypothetical protein
MIAFTPLAKTARNAAKPEKGEQPDEGPVLAD